MENSNNFSIAKILCTNIKKVRNLEGISQEKLAEKIGKSAHYISIVERRSKWTKREHYNRYL